MSDGTNHGPTGQSLAVRGRRGYRRAPRTTCPCWFSDAPRFRKEKWVVADGGVSLGGHHRAAGWHRADGAVRGPAWRAVGLGECLCLEWLDQAAALARTGSDGAEAWSALAKTLRDAFWTAWADRDVLSATSMGLARPAGKGTTRS